jgi:hypothetical protein
VYRPAATARLFRTLPRTDAERRVLTCALRRAARKTSERRAAGAPGRFPVVEGHGLFTGARLQVMASFFAQQGVRAGHHLGNCRTVREFANQHREHAGPEMAGRVTMGQGGSLQARPEGARGRVVFTDAPGNRPPGPRASRRLPCCRFAITPRARPLPARRRDRSARCCRESLFFREHWLTL